MKKFMMALAVMCACAATALAAEAPDPLKKIKATRTITLGYSETAVPFSFVGNDNRPQGYSVDLCKRIADGIQQQLGLTELKINWVKVDVATRIPATMKGAIDIECGSTTHTLSREEQVDFSNMTFVDGGSFISKARNKLATIKELAGRKISVFRVPRPKKSSRPRLIRRRYARRSFPCKPTPKASARCAKTASTPMRPTA